MAELAGPRKTRSNPLNDDLLLFDMYMRALDRVMANSEIRAGLDEFRLPPQTLRGRMITGARQVLKAAPREFAAYEILLGRLKPVSGPETQTPISQPADHPLHTIRMICRRLAAGGLLLAVAGVASIPLWPWTQPLLWAGASTLTAAGILYWAPRLAAVLGIRTLTGEVALDTNPELAEARNRLMAAISQDEFLAQARTFINTARQDQFSHAYSVANISGLSETYDSTYQVPTDTAAELNGLLTRLGGASIGIAGPRGSGKSTLIRGYCNSAGPAQQEPGDARWNKLLEDTSSPEATGGNLRCMVSAPVDYAARDFVLHLFAVFCRSTLRRYDTKTTPSAGALFVVWLLSAANLAQLLLYDIIANGIRYAVPAIVLIHWQYPIAHLFKLHQDWAYYAGIAIATLGNIRLAWAPARMARRTRRSASTETDSGPAIAAAARNHLARVRYLQTFTSGWSGTLSLASSSAQHARSHAHAEQPLSYPEIVDEFREFAREVAADLHRHGDRAFVGIDELDKIGTPEQAERFLNEIKGIFGIPHLYFMVSVSDDALTAFERRGLPLRDAFDSSFDEIIYVGPLSYAESRRLLYRRVIGLTEPYVALCHCLAGGLARDLIRAARQVTRASAALTGGNQPLPDQDELNVDSSTEFLLLRETPAQQHPSLSTVCTAVVQEELRRKTRAVAHVASSIETGHAPDLQDTLHGITRYLTLDTHAIDIVDLACQPIIGQSAALTSLRLDFAAYAYYCATLQDVFTEELDTARMITATSTSPDPGTFDALAAARQAFSLDTHLAWQSITQFRQAWSLETREPPEGDDE
jgi:hypothetical protein